MRSDAAIEEDDDGDLREVQHEKDPGSAELRRRDVDEVRALVLIVDGVEATHRAPALDDALVFVSWQSTCRCASSMYN